MRVTCSMHVNTQHMHSAYIFISNILEPLRNRRPAVQQRSSSCLRFVRLVHTKRLIMYALFVKSCAIGKQHSLSYCTLPEPKFPGLCYLVRQILGHAAAGPAYPPTAGVSSSSAGAGRGPPSGPPPSGRPPPEPLPGTPPVQPHRGKIQHLFCCLWAYAYVLSLHACTSN